MFTGIGLGIPDIIFTLALVGFALWQKSWIRVILSICIIVWGVFAMQFDIKVAAPLLAIGTVLFFRGILNLIAKYRESREES